MVNIASATASAARCGHFVETDAISMIPVLLFPLRTVTQADAQGQRLRAVDMGGGQASHRTMAKVVNLRLARKARDRSDAEAKAAANRASHGRTKARKQADKADREKLARMLDAIRRDD